MVGVLDLPASAFREEGAEVRTSIAVFARFRMRACDVVRQAVSDLAQPLPTLVLQAEDRLYGEPRLSHQLLDDEGPAITRPVTSQNRVRISHDGRRIVLGFDCGFVEAMVLNRVLERRIVSLEGQRLPRGFRYAGTGRLDLEAYLVQPDPIGALGELVGLVKAAGGEPEFAQGFLEHFRQRLRRSPVKEFKNVSYVCIDTSKYIETERAGASTGPFSFSRACRIGVRGKDRGRPEAASRGFPIRTSTPLLSIK
uniref:hypothetical protein n=1 Tax=Cupriavidus necator TaxID=106590 RepID=UPI003F49AF8E